MLPNATGCGAFPLLGGGLGAALAGDDPHLPSKNSMWMDDLQPEKEAGACVRPKMETEAEVRYGLIQ